MKFNIIGRIAIILIFSMLVNYNILSTPKTLYIKSNKEFCMTEHARLCHVVKDPTESTDWRFLYEWIEGFNYEWGHDYTLYVDESEISPRPSNGYKYHYKLIEIISKVKNPKKYSISVISSNSEKYNSNIVKKSNVEYLMYSTVRFKCNESDCRELDKLIKYNYSFLLNFKSPKKSTDPLILLSIKCSDKTEKKYWKSCFK